MNEEREEPGTSERAVDRPVSVTLVPGRTKSIVSFCAPDWAGVARVRGVASGQLDGPVLCGLPDRTSGDAPLLFSTNRGVGVAFRDPDGAFIARLPNDEAELSKPERVLPAARALAFARGRLGGTLIAWDGRRVTALEIDARGVPTGPPATWLERAGRTARLAAARVGGSVVVVVAFDDEDALHVVSADGDRPRAVRHELSSPPVGLALAAAGNRAACALVLEAGLSVAVAQLDATGRFVDRPVTRLQAQGERFDSPSVLHVEDGFAFLIREAERLTAALYRFDGGPPLVTLDRAASPPCAAWHEKRLWVASATAAPGSDAVRVLIRRATLEARQPALVSPLVLEPPMAFRASRAEARAARLLVDAADELGTTTYRGDERGPSASALDREGLSLTLGGVRVSIELQGDVFLLVLVARAAGASTDPVAADSFERLARWVRVRWSKRAWDEAASEAAWVGAIAEQIGGSGRTAPTRNGLVLFITLERLPSGSTFAAWLRRIVLHVHDRNAGTGA